MSLMTSRMSMDEQLEWFSLLGLTSVDRIEVLRDLLYHSFWDHMTAADRAVCQTQWTRLTGSHYDGPYKR